MHHKPASTEIKVTLDHIHNSECHKKKYNNTILLTKKLINILKFSKSKKKKWVLPYTYIDPLPLASENNGKANNEETTVSDALVSTDDRTADGMLMVDDKHILFLDPQRDLFLHSLLSHAFENKSTKWIRTYNLKYIYF